MADPPQKHSVGGPYLPPPPDTADGALEYIEVPRIPPPPASLEAMVPRRSGSWRDSEWGSSRVWVAALLVAVLVALYYLVIRR